MTEHEHAAENDAGACEPKCHAWGIGCACRPNKATMLSEQQRDAIRGSLLAAMSEWSEENYCAGWLIGLEHRLHREGGTWETLGRMVGWPIGVDAEGGWETWEEAGERYATPDYQIEQYGRVVYPTTSVIPPAVHCTMCGGRGEVYDGPRITWKPCPMCVLPPATTESEGA